MREKPNGRGSGEAHVRRIYPSEVRALRRVNSYSEIGRALVIMIDADTFTVNERHNELDRNLRDAQLEPRQSNEKIAILVPKRNIETWIHYLKGSAVDEETSYPKLAEPSLCKADIKQFVEQQPLLIVNETIPASLHTALAEIERIT